jgi:hypothetical protein
VQQQHQIDHPTLEQPTHMRGPLRFRKSIHRQLNFVPAIL